MARRRKDYQPASRAELQAFRDMKQQNVPSGEAGRREQRFLQHLGAAREDLHWILQYNAWRDLGYDTFTGWYIARVQPVALELGFRPAPELAFELLGQFVADNANGPKAQRLLQRELAGLLGVSETQLRRMLQDRSQPPNGAGADLDKNSGDVDSPPSDVPGPSTADDPQTEGSGTGIPSPERPDASAATDPSPSDPSSHSSDASVSEGPADQLGVSSTVTDGGGEPAVATGRPGTSSPVAPDETPQGVAPAGPGDAAEGLESSAATNLIEGRTPNPLAEPVQSLSDRVGHSGGDTVEEEPDSAPEGFSSTDPDSVKAWFASTADRAEELDLDVLVPLLSASDMRRIEYEHERISVIVRLLRRGHDETA